MRVKLVGGGAARSGGAVDAYSVFRDDSATDASQTPKRGKPWSGLRLAGDPDTVEEVAAKLKAWRQLAREQERRARDEARRAQDEAARTKVERTVRATNAGKASARSRRRDADDAHAERREKFKDRLAAVYDSAESARAWNREQSAKIIRDLAKQLGTTPKKLRDEVKPRSVLHELYDQEMRASTVTNPPPN